jgi:hypothetical protein
MLKTTVRVWSRDEDGSEWFMLGVAADDIVRLKNIAACLPGMTVESLLQGMINDAVGMVQVVLEAKHSDMAEAFRHLGDAAAPAPARKGER